MEQKNKEQKSKPKKVIDLRKKYFKKYEKDVVVVKFMNGEYGLYFSANKRHILGNHGGHVFLDDYSENLITKKSSIQIIRLLKYG